MDQVKLRFAFIFSIFLASDAIDTISPNQQLISTENPFIDSSAGTFRLGFFTPAGSRNRYLGIWYGNIPTQRIVWVANRDSPLDFNSSGVFQLSVDGNLQVVSNTSIGSVLWTSGVNTTVRNPIAHLLDTGNLVIREESDADPDNYFWQSFDYPTDTTLPGMKAGRNFVTGVNRILRSWTNQNDPSTGNYSFFLETKGYPSFLLYNGDTERFRSGPWNGERFSGVPGLRTNTIHNFEFVLNQEEAYYRFQLINLSVFSIAVLNSAGIIERLTWNYRMQDWTTLVTLPADTCDTYSLCHAYGSCDAMCAPVCRCLDRFRPKDARGWNAADWSSGCERRTPLNCASDGFVRYTGLKLPDTRNSWYSESMTTKECERMCLRNCSCMAYANTDIRGGGSGCLLWFDELIDIRNLHEYGQDIFIRMASSELESNSVRGMALRLSLPIVAVILLLGVVFVVYKWRRKKEEQHHKPRVTKHGSFGSSSIMLNVGASKREDQELPVFHLPMIHKATDHFSPHNKIGEGGFGPVYKGTLENEQEIAVKRLSKKSIQGVDEFKNEVILIERLQHRNLVKLLGCCVEKEEMMLVYEFMPNNSLDSFIFDENKSKLLDWPSRFRIINGIARGLMYLHEDSRLRIIHRDLKAGNILLDDEMNPKISDFGMARIFGGRETEANTKRVVGTYGYMSPEYAIDGNFSVKSDVFSYGVLVLEIISGCKNRRFLHPDHQHNLLGHAWILHGEGRSSELIDANIRESCHIPEIVRTIHIGLLCVQKNPEDRPSMSNVVLMLSSELALCKSKPPGFFTERNLYNEANSSSMTMSHASTVNEVSMTVMEGR